jgi:hypothetical protein
MRAQPCVQFPNLHAFCDSQSDSLKGDINNRRHPISGDDLPKKHRRVPIQYVRECARLEVTSSSKTLLIGRFPESTIVPVLLGSTGFPNTDDRTVLCWPSAPIIRSASRTVPSDNCTDGLSRDVWAVGPRPDFEGGEAEHTLVLNITWAPARTAALYKMSLRSLNCDRVNE